MPEDLKSKKAELGNDSVKTIHSICCLSCLEEQTKLKNKMVKENVFLFCKKSSVAYTSGANVIKLLTTVIYRHSMAILSFCVIKPYYRGNYHGITINYLVYVKPML